MGRALSGDELDEALEAFADYADVKSPFTLGHSRAWRGWPRAAAATVGLPSDDVVLVRRAALVHDVGAIGVSAGILDKAGPADRGRAGTGPYPPVPDGADLRRSPRRWPRSAGSRRCTTSGSTDRATRRVSPPTASR